MKNIKKKRIGKKNLLFSSQCDEIVKNSFKFTEEKLILKKEKMIEKKEI